MFDPGEGTQHHMLNYGVSIADIDKIFITHFHGDHCLGLPGVIQGLSANRVAHEVEVFYPASGQVFFDRLRQASYFEDHSRLKPVPIFQSGVVYEDDALVIRAEKLSHDIECYGYRIEDKARLTLVPEKLEAFGIRGADVGRLKREGQFFVGGQMINIDDISETKRGKSFAFVQDTDECDGVTDLLAKTSLAVVEATYLCEDDKPSDNVAHLTVDQATRLANSAGAQQVVLTHFSTRYHDLEPLAQAARANHPAVFLAKEGDRFDF